MSCELNLYKDLSDQQREGFNKWLRNKQKIGEAKAIVDFASHKKAPAGDRIRVFKIGEEQIVVYNFAGDAFMGPNDNTHVVIGEKVERELRLASIIPAQK